MTDILFIGEATEAPEAIKNIEFKPEELVVTFNNGMIRRYPNRKKAEKKKDEE